ncbi:hypothetical protein HKCCSP123_18960 [Rhodobacterales bacterium HKCCSP123]|nr:hypothetical protein [Rhodobacterales bacterium HKCCSP123]
MVSRFGGRWADRDGTLPGRFPARQPGGITLEAIPDVPGPVARITGLIDAIDPDILCIQEGPPRAEQMRHFIDAHLGGRFDAVQSNGQWQTNHFLIRKGLGLEIAADDPMDRAAWEAQNDEPDDAEDRLLRRSDHLPVSATVTL